MPLRTTEKRKNRQAVFQQTALRGKSESEVIAMANYREMYSILCAAMSDALDNLKNTPDNEAAIFIMSDALDRAENLYIESSDADIP